MKISMRAIGICVSAAVLAGCGGHAVPPASTTPQAQEVGGQSRAMQQPATYKITIENVTKTAWKIVARGFRHSCIQDIDPATDQRITYGSSATFAIRTGDLSQCPPLGMDRLAYASIDLLLDEGRGASSPQQSINLMEFADSEAELEIFEGQPPFGGVICVHPTYRQSGWHVIKPNENVHLTFRVC